MIVQLLRSFRGSVLIQVFSRAIDMGAHGQKMALNEVRLTRRRHADGNVGLAHGEVELAVAQDERSEEHTSELQSLMRISYAVFCLKKKKPKPNSQNHNYNVNNTHST